MNKLVFGVATVLILSASMAMSPHEPLLPLESQARTPPTPSTPATSADLFAIPVKTLEGDPAKLDQYRGKVVLIVNVASKCGYTPQYTELEEIFMRFKDRGLVILGFPSNDFGGQEPGSSKEIRDFCTRQYAVTFPLMEKIQTKAGSGQSPVYALLSERTGKLPTWNFGKYLVERDGRSTAYFDSKVKPTSDELVKAIEAALAKAVPTAPGAPSAPAVPSKPGAPSESPAAPAGGSPKAPTR